MLPASNSLFSLHNPASAGFLLVTMDLSRSDGSVTTIRKPARPEGLPKGARPFWTLAPRRVAGMQGVKHPCFPASRVSASICIKGEGYARHPRPVAGEPALRPPVSPLTPIPA